MKNIFILAILLLLAGGNISAQNKRSYKKFSDTTFQAGDVILAPQIQFYMNDCKIVPESKDSVKLIADFYKKHPAFKIEIGVHTDIRGKKEANLKLSQCRAASVTDYLTKEQLLPADNFAAKGYGSSSPIYDDAYFKKMMQKDFDMNKIESLHLKNRRVEIKIFQTK